MSREEYVKSLPHFDHYDPCRCLKFIGYELDSARNQWVCKLCRKSGGLDRLRNPFCYSCGEPFTLAVYDSKNKEEPWCPNCA